MRLSLSVDVIDRLKIKILFYQRKIYTWILFVVIVPKSANKLAKLWSGKSGFSGTQSNWSSPSSAVNSKVRIQVTAIAR